MGATVCEAVRTVADLELAAEVDVGDSLSVVADAGAQVAVDFTQPDAVMGNLRWCVDNGVHAVVGTTGFDAGRIDEVRSWLGASPNVGVAIVPNFGIGAVLMMAFAEKAAR
jgi:4-hydroxy-tetrahydrodipicolinate reductase